MSHFYCNLFGCHPEQGEGFEGFHKSCPLIFLAWLEREIGAPIDNLTRKTHLRNYLGDYQKGESHRALEEVLDILRRNRRRLKVDPSERAFQEQLAGESEGSLGKLLPLKARLAGTDRLIDLIVYRLYGLTEEEIAVVEGTE